MLMFDICLLMFANTSQNYRTLFCCNLSVPL
nr:MAG TPA: hypothetical protein [Caudoviricetes sp.]